MKSIKNTVINHFDCLANHYDRKCLNRQAYLQSIDNLILAYLQKQRSKKLKILDVGCGTGRRTEKYKLNLEGSVVYGCDISPIMIDMAQRRNIDKAILSDMTDLPFNQESFDVILCLFNSFGYVPDRKQRLQVLTQFSKILNNNGLLFIDVMNQWHMGEGLNFKKSIYSILRTYITSVLSPDMSSGDLYFSLSLNDREIEGWVHGFSDSEMRFLLTQSNFSIKDRCYVGYDSGALKKYFWQGQLFYICEKDAQTRF